MLLPNPTIPSSNPSPPSASDRFIPNLATAIFERSMYARIYKQNKIGSKCTHTRRRVRSPTVLAAGRPHQNQRISASSTAPPRPFVPPSLRPIIRDLTREAWCADGGPHVGAAPTPTSSV